MPDSMNARISKEIGCDGCKYWVLRYDYAGRKDIKANLCFLGTQTAEYAKMVARKWYHIPGEIEVI